MSDDNLDVPRHSYEALAKRWDRSPWTIKSWVMKGRLSKPIYLSANCPRFLRYALLRCLFVVPVMTSFTFNIESQGHIIGCRAVPFNSFRLCDK
jgi:hypothetical protein